MSLASRLHQVEERIARAAERVGRDPREVLLVAVSKTHPAGAIVEAMAAGQRVFGENRVQEASDKSGRVEGATWHLVGRLQRNKARRAVEVFSVIQSLDSDRLASVLDRLGLERGTPVDVFVEVDLAGEETKGGIAESELPAFLDLLVERRGLAVRGLMAIPPFFENPEHARPYFRRLRAIAEREAARKRPNIGLGQLSMGMSGDFEVAIEEGATIVRVGTAIFGSRLAGSSP